MIYIIIPFLFLGMWYAGTMLIRCAKFGLGQEMFFNTYNMVIMFIAVLVILYILVNKDPVPVCYTP